MRSSTGGCEYSSQTVSGCGVRFARLSADRRFSPRASAGPSSGGLDGEAIRLALVVSRPGVQEDREHQLDGREHEPEEHERGGG